MFLGRSSPAVMETYPWTYLYLFMCIYLTGCLLQLWALRLSWRMFLHFNKNCSSILLHTPHCILVLSLTLHPPDKTKPTLHLENQQRQITAKFSLSSFCVPMDELTDITRLLWDWGKWWDQDLDWLLQNFPVGHQWRQVVWNSVARMVQGFPAKLPETLPRE